MLIIETTDTKQQIAQDTPRNPRLAAALAVAASGWPVFPVYWMTEDGSCACWLGEACSKKGKHPTTLNGHLDARTEPDVITLGWEDEPRANVGIALPAGVVVIDVDPRNGGDKTIEELQATHGTLPETLTCETGGGGQHYYFVAPAGAGLPGKLGTGIELKQLGGYTIAPPSKHESGRFYEWRNAETPLAPLPSWVAEAARVYAPQPKRQQTAVTEFHTTQETSGYGFAALEAECKAISNSPNGEQESTLNKSALKIGSLIAGGEIAEADARACLLEAGLAMTNHDPGSPWTAAQIEAKISRGFRDGANTPRSARSEADRRFSEAFAKDHALAVSASRGPHEDASFAFQIRSKKRKKKVSGWVARTLEQMTGAAK